jgi:hypothetical protein
MVALKAIGVFSTRSEIFRHLISFENLPFFFVVKLSRTLQSQLAPDALAWRIAVGP